MFYAGASRVCIDPTDDMFPMTNHFGVMDGIYSSCFCRVIAVKDDRRLLVLVVLELSDRPLIDNFNEKIAEQTGCAAEDIIISVTHNHSSPCDVCAFPVPETIARHGLQWRALLLERTIEAVREAVGRLQPARIGYGTAESLINVNRDYETLAGYWVEAANPAGYTDHTLKMIKIVDENGKLIAALLNHCTHANSVFMHPDTDGVVKMSGNFTGVTCAFLEEYYGEGAVVAWTSGAAGDQNPVMVHGLQLEYPDGYTTTIEYPAGVGYLIMEHLGRRHAADAVRGLAQITEYSKEADLYHSIKTVHLPRQRRPGGEPYRMGGTGPRRPTDKPEPAHFPQMILVPEEPVEVQVELWVLGEIAVICVGAEIYCHIGSLLMKLSPYQNTMVMTHTYYHQGYALDKDSVRHKVFQSFTDIVPGESEDILSACVNELLREYARTRA